MMTFDKTTLRSRFLALGGLTLYFYLATQSLPENNQNDLCVYRAGARVALNGHSPYNTDVIRREVAKQLPPKHALDVALNCGFFLPPQGIAMFAPMAEMKWESAEVFWFLILTLFGFCCGCLAWTFGRAPGNDDIGWAIIVVVVLLNPITQLTLVVGQTGLLFAGCIAFGQYCFQTGAPRLGSVVWALTFVKPHLALPFFVLAWILGGWKRAAGIAIVVAALNLIGGMVVTGTVGGALRLFRAYVDYVATAHKFVVFNLVADNYQILSWNRMIAAAGGPAFDLKIWMILSGYALWSFLIFCRLRLSASWRDVVSMERLDQAYLLAVTATGALFFSQVLAYELILAVLVAPHLLRQLDHNRRADSWFLIALLLCLMLPISLIDRIAESMQLREGSTSWSLMRSHKCYGMGVLALYLLARGPITTSASFADSSYRPK